MKVLQVNKFYFPVIGGVETVVKQYSESLSKEGNNVTVLCVKKERDFKTSIEIVKNIRVVRCSSLGTFFSMPLSFSFYYYFFKLRKKVDIVHFHEPFPLASLLVVFKKKHLKYIVTWHSDIYRQKFIKWFFVLFQRLLCRKADVITTTSPQLLNFSDVLRGFRKKVKIIPLSIDSKNYLEENLVDTFNDLPKEYILYLGRLSYYKGISFLLKAYVRLSRKIPLVIVGRGDEDVLILKYKKEYSNEIIFINRFVSEKEKRALLKKCRFLVFPSIYPSEAFGILQLEAMIYEKPVINTSLPTGVPWVSKNDETGITVEVNNVDQLRDAMRILIERDDLRKMYGKKAKERVLQYFDDRVVLKDLFTVYDKI